MASAGFPRVPGAICHLSSSVCLGRMGREKVNKERTRFLHHTTPIPRCIPRSTPPSSISPFSSTKSNPITGPNRPTWLMGWSSSLFDVGDGRLGGRFVQWTAGIGWRDHDPRWHHHVSASFTRVQGQARLAILPRLTWSKARLATSSLTPQTTSQHPTTQPRGHAASMLLWIRRIATQACHWVEHLARQAANLFHHEKCAHLTRVSAPRMEPVVLEIGDKPWLAIVDMNMCEIGSG